MKQQRQIELRSEKVRNIIGQVPSVLLRYGMIIIGSVLLCIVGISAFLPYRETIPILIEIQSNPQSVLVKANFKGEFILEKESNSETVIKNDLLGYIICQDTLIKVLAPTDGRIVSNISNNENVKKNDVLFLVIPHTIHYYGKAQIEFNLVRKIKNGDKVTLQSLQGNITGNITIVHPLIDDNGMLQIVISFDDKDSFMYSQKAIPGEIVLSKNTILGNFLKVFSVMSTIE